MALTIQTELNTVYGFPVTNSYGRVAVVNQFEGNVLQAAVEVYTNEAAFNAASKPLQVVDVVMNASQPYDYSTDGHDILDLAHDMMITALAQQGVTAVKNL